MKALDKFITSILFCFIITSCSKSSYTNKNIDIQKMTNLESDFPITEGMWGISDGIKISNGFKTEYFIFEIESPPDIIRRNADMRIIHKIDSSEQTIYENIYIYSMDSSCPLYWVNTLDVLVSNEQYGVYFYTSLAKYPSGLDPSTVTLWLFYNAKLYQTVGTVPIHEDWNWKDNYTVMYNAELEKDHPDIYITTKEIWNNKMNIYRKKLYDL